MQVDVNRYMPLHHRLSIYRSHESPLQVLLLYDAFSTDIRELPNRMPAADRASGNQNYLQLTGY